MNTAERFFNISKFENRFGYGLLCGNCFAHIHLYLLGIFQFCYFSGVAANDGEVFALYAFENGKALFDK
jgi:hypothetical protein